jgi:effector-binding domain-containing protein
MEMKVVTIPSETWAFVSRRSGLGGKEINATLEQAFEQLAEKIARGGIRTCGQPRAHFRHRNASELGFDIGFPIDPADKDTARRAGLDVGETASVEALIHIHRGPYARLGDAYSKMERDMERQGLKGRGDLWEVYVNDPDERRASDLLTQIVWPLEQPAHA